MFLRRATRSVSTRPSAYTRTVSTVTGASGHVYTQKEVLQRDPRTNEPRIFKAQCGSECSVFKRVSESFYDLSELLASEFHESHRLRTHTDCNRDERILVYPYFRGTLLSLMQNDPEFPPVERYKVLRGTAEALQEMHKTDWVHLDVKPDNILVDWTCDQDGNKTVTNMALGDFDLSFKWESGKRLDAPYPLGNAMWRSPEGQTGKGMSKASDVFFIRACELLAKNISPEQEILTRHFCYFGPATRGLLNQVGNDTWCKALMGASAIADRAVADNPALRFQVWGDGLGSIAVDALLGMTKPDPMARFRMDQVLDHAWWREEE